MPPVSLVLSRGINRLTQVPKHPLRQMLIWYIGVGVLGAVLAARIPAVHRAVFSDQLAAVGDVTSTGISSILPPTIGSVAIDATMIIVMLGTLLLTIPVSWGYMAVREAEGFDQSVVQTIVVLPLVVAGIMMIVQHSLALAFALAGVSAAVRFRNTLKNVADATYVFLALGMGMAAGVGSLAAAAMMSVIFVYVSVLLWRCNFGACHKESTQVMAYAPDAPGTPRLPKKQRTGTLTVHVRDATKTRAALESVLDRVTKRWQFQRIEPDGNGSGLAFYQVRLKKSMNADLLTGELVMHGGGEVESAIFDITMKSGA